MGGSEEEHTASGSSEYSTDESSEYEFVDPEEEGDGTRGLSDVLAMVGIAKDKGSKPQPLLDAEGNPIQPVCDANGQMVAPRMEDEHGNVIHEGPKGSGMKTAAILGGAALATVAAVGTAAVATGVGVHYYRKKIRKERKTRRERKIRKIRKERKIKKTRKI